jgi:glutamine amidotransferase
MTHEVAIADLGLGNLRSVARAIERAGGAARVVSDPEQLLHATRVVVPGQGAFRDCALALQRGFAEALGELLKRGTPYLGICLGMQLLFESSEEAVGAKGLGFFAGTVKRFPDAMRDPDTQQRLKVPHMGWNEVEAQHALLPARAHFYFVHSYYCAPDDPSLTVGVTRYGEPFCAALAQGHVFACQFHPEKSQDQGQRLLESFLRTS